MHIKAIVLQGFKTYNEPATIVFSERCTCLIGHNGSGKSNVLLGVAFALGEIGNSAAERRLLLHEGVQGRVASGFVELTLINRERRLCMFDSDEVVIRRVFSLTSDDLFVQGKHLSKGEFDQLIECAGLSGGGSRFSRSSSSSGFIIRQGRIQEVALLSPEGRLRLLLSAGGCCFFEAKAKETDQMLQQADSEKAKVCRSLAELKDKLDAMDAERKELNECLSLERQKAALEMALNEAAWQDATDALRAAEQQQSIHRNAIRRLAAAAAEAEAARDDAATHVARLSVQLAAQTTTKETAENNALELQGEETRLRLESSLLTGRREAQQQRDSKMQQQLQQKQEEMKRIQKDIEQTLRPQHTAATAAYRAAQQQHSQLQLQLQQLELRTGRSGVSTAARLSALKQNLREVEAQQRSHQELLKPRKQKEEALRKEVEAAAAAAAAAKEEEAAAAETVRETSKQITSLREPAEELVERLRLQQAKLSALLQQRAAADASLQAAKDAFWSSVPYDTASSLQRIETLAETKQWKSQSPLVGLLAHFVTVDSEYQRAVEATGGFSLMHFVLPGASFALEAVAWLKQQQQQQRQQQRRCCLSLVPLKEVAQQQRDKQRNNTRWQQQQRLANQLLQEGAAMPLTECVGLLPEVTGEEAADLEVYIRSIFGRSLLVPSLDSPEVLQWNNQGFDCVTLDGDVSFASGAMRGGGGPKAGRLPAYMKLRDCLQRSDQLHGEIAANQHDLQLLQQEQKRLLEKEQLLSEKRLHAQLKLEANLATQQRAQMAARAATSLLAAIKEEEEAAAILAASRKQLLQSLRHETLQARPSPLNPAEQQQLQLLPGLLLQQQQQLLQLLQRVEETGAALKTAEEAVEVSLRRAIERLEREAKDTEGAWGSEGTESISNGLQAAARRRQQEEETAAELESRIRSLENEIAAARKNQEAAEVSLQSLLQQLAAETALLQQAQQAVESIRRVQAEAASLLSAAAAAAGAAAAAARPSLAAQSRECLYTQLEDVKRKLSGFSQVNRKAVAELATIKDDFNSLQRRESLQEETLEVLQGQLQQLQRRRKQLLQQLLQRIDKEFRTLFAQLVPEGHARLELVHEASQGGEIDSEVRGVEIHANFISATPGGSRFSMQRLSGGQKALVALALLLSLQRVGYDGQGGASGLLLLDEADSALDETHRRLLAAVLKASSDSLGCQIILTTFRPELLACGDRFLLVQQSQRASRLRELEREEAEAILADMPQPLQAETTETLPLMPAAPHRQHQQGTVQLQV